MPVWRNGRRTRLKILRGQLHVGSTPTTGTKIRKDFFYYLGASAISFWGPRKVHTLMGRGTTEHKVKLRKYWTMNKKRLLWRRRTGLKILRRHYMWVQVQLSAPSKVPKSKRFRDFFICQMLFTIYLIVF